MATNGAIHETARIHPTALIEEGVSIGPRSSIWDNVHIRHGARIGHDTIVGEKSYIAYDVPIGDFVKINAMVYICAEVEIGSGVMISAGTTFTNDLYPRALDKELRGLETSAVTEETLRCIVEDGVTIGAQATIGPGLTLGRFSMVGMGSVVTHDVPPFTLVVGNPARPVGMLCACGPRLVSHGEFLAASPDARWTCHRCSRVYGREGASLVIVSDPHGPGVIRA